MPIKKTTAKIKKINLRELPEIAERNFDILEEKIGVKFKNFDLLVQAFVHRSYLE